ncbi:hypothetical protein OKW38_002839 [Paraburkholderia sp. MM5496-R1]
MSNSSPTSPMKVSGPWFYVCYGSREGRGMGDGFVVQTYSDLYKLLTEESADKTEADVYICSKEKGGPMAFRRVVALRPVRSPDMHAFELEAGQVVLWVDGKTSAKAYIEIGGRVSLVD